jgi:hypothetical protein
MEYKTPSIKDYGDVRQITAGLTAHQYDDAAHATGQSALANTSGPCASYGGVTLPCT